MTLNVEGENLKKIHMNLKPGEIGITFINHENAKLILVSTPEEEFLVLLEMIGEVDLKKELRSFSYQSINPLLVSSEIPLVEHDQKHFQVIQENYEIGDVEVFLNDAEMILDYHDYRFCAVTRKGETTDDCSFFYLLDPTYNQELDDDLKVVFYDEGISEEMILKNYNNWIDTVRLSNKNYTTLLLTTESYNVVQIPKNTTS